MADPIENQKVRRCRCGHDRNHPDVEAHPSYGFFAWLLLLNGATGKPKKITYTCRVCGEDLGTTRDPAVLRRFR